MKCYKVMNLKFIRNLKRKLKNKKVLIPTIIALLVLIIVIPCAIYLPKPKDVEPPAFVIQRPLTPNKYSRCGEPLKRVKNIVIHYVGNPGSTAMQNRNYFNNLKTTHQRSVSSHFVVGLEGEIVQCIPLNEVAYANYPRNYDTISIEVCHEDATGKFSKVTYDSVIKLTAWLCDTYHLSYKDVIRHYDVRGKNCPKYYVEHPKAWKQFRLDVKAEIKKNY